MHNDRAARQNACTCLIAGGGQEGGKGSWLKVSLPLGRGAVVTVGVDVVIVRIESGEDGGSRRTAHGSRGVGMTERRSLLLHDLPCLWHEVH